MVPHIGWQGWVTLSLILLMLLALVAELAPPYLVMMATLITFLPLGILDLEQALHGFGDNAVLSIAVLFIVAKGIELSGGLEYVSKVLFRPEKKEENPNQLTRSITNSIVWVLLKFTVPVAFFSAFLANIPLVAMMIPPIVEFSRKVNVSPSKLLLPLSYAALLGGNLTLIGASTNLVIISLAAKKLPQLRMNIFEIGVVGVPVTVAGILYILALSGKLLPDRLAIQATSINLREYNVVLAVKAISSLNRKSIEQSGLKRMPGLNLVQIKREEVIIHNPGPDFVILPKDLLHFTAVIDALLALTQLDGLALSEDEGEEQVDLNRLNVNQCLVEAVIASRSSMVGKKISELQFRSRYRTAVVAVHRHRTRLNKYVSQVQLPGFVPIQRKKACLAALIVLIMVAASGFGVELITSALFSAAALLLTKCLSPRDAMNAVELPVLIMIAAAFGISEAMVQSGAADLVAKALMGLAGKSQMGLITWTYIATTVFSLAITNNAAVTIMFPVALAAVQTGNLDFRPFAYILMVAASAGLMTPTGCPTNLMVYAPGGYRFTDYIIYGGPLQLWLLFVTVGVTLTLRWWWIWWIVLFFITACAIPLLVRQPSNNLELAKIIDDDASAGDKRFSLQSDEESDFSSLNKGGFGDSAMILATSSDRT